MMMVVVDVAVVVNESIERPRVPRLEPHDPTIK